MTPETFVEKSDQLIDAPNAVVKMRELVLQLAIEGKLVEQRDEDGNAAQLLIAISQERKDAALKMRTPLELAASDGEGNPFQIPATWEWTRLGNLALQIEYGYTASADVNETEIRMLRITDIQNNRVDWSAVPGCEIRPIEAEKYLLSPNDILIARTGGTIGKSIIVPDTPVKSVFASYLIRVTPPHSMVARYLKNVLESPLYWRQLRAMSTGTGQPNINGRA
jgi:type I restriction enzyme S subunit